MDVACLPRREASNALEIVDTFCKSGQELCGCCGGQRSDNLIRVLMYAACFVYLCEETGPKPRRRGAIDYARAARRRVEWSILDPAREVLRNRV